MKKYLMLILPLILTSQSALAVTFFEGQKCKYNLPNGQSVPVTILSNDDGTQVSFSHDNNNEPDETLNRNEWDRLVPEDFQNKDEEEPLICPLTREEIKVAGIVCSGNIYEYDAISYWMELKDTDPLTNLHLPTRFVLRHDNLSTAKAKAQDVKMSTLLWSHSAYTRTTIDRDRFERLEARKSEVLQGEAWQSRQEEVQSNYTNISELAKNFGYFRKGVELNNENDGYLDFQFLDLSPEDLIIIEGAEFKGSLFDFAKVRNYKFVNCSFGNTSFIGTDFENVTFKDCTFQGNFTFHEATGVINIERSGKFEFLSWKLARSWEDVLNIFYNERGFKGTIERIR